MLCCSDVYALVDHRRKFSNTHSKLGWSRLVSSVVKVTEQLNVLHGSCWIISFPEQDSHDRILKVAAEEKLIDDERTDDGIQCRKIWNMDSKVAIPFQHPNVGKA
ncbi:hypothetical protein T11_9648 [Trichinella zimbabwensis]|uniref:Uncharacterized protein n=1 Tax=Trichinella zimbabwensis TaxID=268475 RepID=A0A0V1H9E7_9BILA|nr:hypothetical protein T11_9648 [Trichinella zimbabwensis]